jgi:hypothetical protein
MAIDFLISSKYFHPLINKMHHLGTLTGFFKVLFFFLAGRDDSGGGGICWG